MKIGNEEIIIQPKLNSLHCMHKLFKNSQMTLMSMTAVIKSEKIEMKN